MVFYWSYHLFRNSYNVKNLKQCKIIFVIINATIKRSEITYNKRIILLAKISNLTISLVCREISLYKDYKINCIRSYENLDKKELRFLVNIDKTRKKIDKGNCLPRTKLYKHWFLTVFYATYICRLDKKKAIKNEKLHFLAQLINIVNILNIIT